MVNTEAGPIRRPATIVIMLQFTQPARAALRSHAGPTHSLVPGTGEARAATPWDALQRAAWEALSAAEPTPGS
jgi:hypothetical protein